MTKLSPSEVIEKRIAELPMTKVELYRLARISDVKFQQIQRGELEGVKPSTFAKMAKALGWAPDELIALLREGKQPTTVISADSVEARLDRIESLILELMNRDSKVPAKAAPKSRSGG